jgi:branched-chain amino acid transport system substrate-binding protein
MIIRTRVIAAVLVVALAFGGWTALSSAPVAGASPAPIKVGVVCSCTGAVGAAFVLVTDGYLAWADATNAKGGIDGHKIDVIEVNDQSTPGTSITEAHTLVSDGVVAVMVSSLVQQAFLPVLASAGIPVVGEAYGVAGLPQNTDVFGTTDTIAPASLSAVEDVDLAKAAHVKKLAYLYETTAASTGLTTSELSTAAAKAGIKVVYSVATSLTQTNYEAECIAAEQAGATGLIDGAGAPSNVEAAASSCSLENYRPVYFVSAQNWTGISPALARDSYMSSATAPPFDTNIPAIKLWRATVNKYFPGALTSPDLDPEVQISTYEGGLLLHDALVAAHLTPSEKVTSKLIVKGLYSLKGDSLGGLAPPITYEHGTTHVLDCWFESRQVNGKVSILNGGKGVCAS